MHISTLVFVLASLVATDAQSADVTQVNAATITDATGAIQTPTESIAQVSPTVIADVVSSNGVNPLKAPDAVTATNLEASTVATDTLSTDLIKPTVVAAVAAPNLFAQIASDDPVAVLGGTITNQVPPVALSDANYNGANGLPIQTNKFYGNLLNGDRTQTVFTMPYSLFWSKSRYGLCVSNAANTDYAFGPTSQKPTYYYSPIFRCPIGFSSSEMDSSQTMSLSRLNMQSVDVTFAPSNNAGSMKTTLVQGSAFITMTYSNLRPILFSGTGAFTSLTPVTFKAPVNTNGVSKYRITSNNGDTWLIYVFQSGGQAFSLVIDSGSSGSQLLGTPGFSGTIQIAKLPAGATATDEAFYDSGAGTFPTNSILSGTANGASGSYTFDYQPTSLISNPLLTYLFPHQQQSVSTGAWSDLKLWSTTKGLMRARYGNTLTFTETNLPIDIQFLPWSPLGNLQNYSAPALQAIAAAANVELKQSISQQSNLADMYFSGKVLAKFAQICLAVNDVLGADATDCVSRLESATELFTNGNNQNPFRYDTTWKGAISSCGQGQNLGYWQGCAFGHAVYNDHHFHASYVVYTAAVLAHLDPSWLSRGKNKAYINVLVRDFANPTSSDKAFPVFRSFDWVSGHSWAHGLLASGDGKDEESSSEDYNSYYAMKLWGKVIGDSSMEARGNLMLSIMRRSMQSYMLMAQDNTVQPPNFIHNYVAGITFENKVDHTTYFGTNTEYIHGIHMLPLTPMSAFIRTPTFVAQEWNAVLKPITPSVEGTGWSGILWANLAISNSTASYNYFSKPNFSSSNLDDGASLTWYLTYAAGLGGAGNFQLAVNASDGTVVTSRAPQTPVTSTRAPSSSSAMMTTTSKSTSRFPTVTGSPVILPGTSTTARTTTSRSSSRISTSSTRTTVRTSTSSKSSTKTSSPAGCPTSKSSTRSSSSVSSPRAVVFVPASESLSAFGVSVVATAEDITAAPTSSVPASASPQTSTVSDAVVSILPGSSVVTSIVIDTVSIAPVTLPAIMSSEVQTLPAITTQAAISTAPRPVDTIGSGDNGAQISSSFVVVPISTIIIDQPAGSTNSVDSQPAAPPAVVLPQPVFTTIVTVPAQGGNGDAPGGNNPAPGTIATVVVSQPSTPTGSSGNGVVIVPGQVPSTNGNGAPAQTLTIVVDPSYTPPATMPTPVVNPPYTSPATNSSNAPAATSLTPALSGTCGGTPFQAGAYVCWEDKQLCPIISGVIFQNCNGACFDPSLYHCANGGLAQGAAGGTPTPGKLATCGDANYDTAAYTCFGTQLCPIQGGVATQACGRDCYNPAIYGCANGQLTLLMI